MLGEEFNGIPEEALVPREADEGKIFVDGKSAAQSDAVAQAEGVQPKVEVSVSAEAEQWYRGTVEKGISNALLVRLEGTKDAIWIVVNEATRVPSGGARPSLIDKEGRSVPVEFTITKGYEGALVAAQNEFAAKVKQAEAKGEDTSVIEKPTPVVHAAKYANDRTKFVRE